ncbi:hypothetical protein [Amaricoccus tamworthensis]|uniref:hypothetical protein n=1 Tax=Amaricoccus tamworthensis TaxID=57002 RepID=UPI003C7D0ED8
MAELQRFGAYSGFRGYASSTFKRFSRDKKVDVMVNWFHHHFEDPANRVSYNTAEGGYLWVGGLGPFEANDEIQNEFSDVADFDLMQEAVEEIEADGTIEWASINYGGQDDEELHFLEEHDATAGTSPTFFSSAFSDAFSKSPPAREAAQREMLKQLDRLEEIITPLSEHFGKIGHNGPPGPIEDPTLPEPQPDLTTAPLTSIDLNVLKQAIDDTRRQAELDKPDVAVVEKSQGILSRAGNYIARYCDLAMQESAKEFGKWGARGAAALLVSNVAGLSWAQVGEALSAAAKSILDWVQVLPPP